MTTELAVIHVAGPRLYGHQECIRCGYVFHHYDPANPPATLADDPHDPMESSWLESSEVLVMSEPGQGRYMAAVGSLRPDRDTSDEVNCA